MAMAERPDSLMPQTLPAAAAPNATLASPTQTDFMQQLALLCEAGSQMGLAGWDLPLPQGPHIVQHLPANSPAMPLRSVTVSIPFFYPLQSNDQLLDDIVHEQQRQAGERGIDASAAGLRHSDAVCADIRRAASGAHRPQTLPRAVGSRAVPCCRNRRDPSPQHRPGREIRKAISACRRGKRQRVSWFNPRP